MGYGAAEIVALEGLAAVRQGPGMYIGSTGWEGLHHLIAELVANSVDEAMAGRCGRIWVVLHADGSCSVEDDGAGIPVGLHPQFPTMSGVEVVLTKLHAGGKFGTGAYTASGGLHGVGVSVVNALSSRLEVTVHQGGETHAMAFVDGGRAVAPLAVVGRAPDRARRTGTVVRFWPDPAVFAEPDGTTFDAALVAGRLETIACLHRGLAVSFRDERPGGGPDRSFLYRDGIVDYVRQLHSAKQPLCKRVGHVRATDSGIECEVAFQWHDGFREDLRTYANGIATKDGGTHEEGFKKALTGALNKKARERGWLKEKEENLLGEDVREGMTAIVSVRLAKPQFEGQMKHRLVNALVRTAVERIVNDKVAEWLDEHPAEGRAIVAKARSAAKARTASKRAREAVRRKSSLDGVGMPDKLRDCARGTRAEDAELFIVEGDSAGGSATQARDPKTQAILPIRGKILNVEKSSLEKMLKNAEVQALISAIGAGVGAGFDVSKARYQKVCILADADVDGSHIRTLLLTFLYRQMKPLVEAGFVYICQPPLFSTVVGKDRTYLKDERAKAAFLAANPSHRNDFNRLKGLGEMDFEELKATTMDPSRRTLLQISVEQAALADEVMSVLMGDDVEVRKRFITTNAADVRFLDV